MIRSFPKLGLLFPSLSSASTCTGPRVKTKKRMKSRKLLIIFVRLLCLSFSAPLQIVGQSERDSKDLKREGFLRLRCFSSPRHEATTSLLLFQAVISLPPFSSTFDLYRSEHKSLCSSLLKRLLIFFLPFEKSGQLNSFSFGSGFPLQLLANE